jgi:hypothetical protein
MKRPWSKSSWVCLGLAILSIMAGATLWGAQIPDKSTTDRLIPVMGAQLGWGFGLGWAAVGAAWGFYGMSKRTERTNSARAAITLNLVTGLVCVLAMLKLMAM